MTQTIFGPIDANDADIYARDATNRTALDYAVKHGHARVESLLRQYGAA